MPKTRVFKSSLGYKIRGFSAHQQTPETVQVSSDARHVRRVDHQVLIAFIKLSPLATARSWPCTCLKVVNFMISL